MANEKTAPAPPFGRLFTVRDACAFLGGMLESRLRYLIATKRIGFIKDGRILFTEQDLLDYLARHRIAPTGDGHTLHIELPTPTEVREPGDVSDLMPRRLRLQPGPTRARASSRVA